MARTMYFVLVVLALLIGLFFLQYYLSTRRSKWPGLVLPALAVVWGLIFALSSTTIPAAAAGFLLGGGIPCIIYLAIYRAGREKVQRQSQDQLKKMNIQDL